MTRTSWHAWLAAAAIVSVAAGLIGALWGVAPSASAIVPTDTPTVTATNTATGTPTGSTPVLATSTPAPTYTPVVLPNDNAGSAVVVNYLPFVQAIDTTTKTLEPGEPQPCASMGKTVWYTISSPGSPPYSGSITVDTLGSDFNTAIAVYTYAGGPLPASLVNVACNDDAAAQQARLTFTASPGIVYYVQAGGSSGASGNLMFSAYEGTPKGAVAGVITNALGTPIAGANVDASPYGCCAGSYGTAISAADGSYFIGGFEAGWYRVQATAAGFAAEYYDDTYAYWSASQVGVLNDSVASGINFALIPGGGISGTVTNALGAPIAGADVSASHDDVCCGWGYATTAGDGTYTITDLAPGSYRVDANAAGYAGEYYNGTYDWSAATLVSVSSGSTTPGIDFAFAPEGSISGTITNASGTPIAGAAVNANRDTCCDGGGATTAPDGTYTINDLAPGSYRVDADAEAYAGEYYNNTYDWSAATLVTVASEVTTPGIDFALAPGGSISGIVTDALGTPIADANVYASRDACCDSGWSSTAGDGSYTITDLAPDSYRVDADAVGYAGEYYNDTYDWDLAALVSVSSGATTPGIGFALARANDIMLEAVNVTPLPFIDTMSTAGATLQIGEPQPCGSIGATVWYVLIVPSDVASLVVAVDTAGSTFDTVVAAYDGLHPMSPPGGITNIACNDNGGTGFGLQSRLSFTGLPGHAYYIQAGGASGATGTLTLNVTCNSDGDCDGVTNASDNCVSIRNPGQENTDAGNTAIGFPGTDTAGDACDSDDDGDGCADAEETATYSGSENFGGWRDANFVWDFYDVNGDQRIDLNDTLDILAHFGHGTADDPLDNRMDRMVPDGALPWQTAEDTSGNGIDLTDALVSLSSFGHDCSAPPD